MRELEGCSPPCTNCRASTVDLDLPCYRATPEAQAKMTERERRAAMPSRWRTVFDAECERRRADRQEPVSAFSDILKWHYSMHREVGLYRDVTLVQEIHRYEVRVQQLRGTKPRYRDEVAASIPGLKTESIWDTFGASPLFALLGRTA